MTAIGLHLERPVPYAPALEAMRGLREARVRDEIPDVVVFLEHPPTITLGRRGRTAALLLPHEDYARRGIALHHVERGGDATFHGPGQVVMYPIIRLGDRAPDAHGYMHNLEETAIRTAADFGLRAFRRDGRNGAWTERGKLAAIGFHLRRWVTSHGMSFNVAPDPEGFATIVPCGLSGEPVTSLRELLGGRCPPVAGVRERLAEHFSSVFARPLLPYRAVDGESAESSWLSSVIEATALHGMRKE